MPQALGPHVLIEQTRVPIPTVLKINIDLTGGQDPLEGIIRSLPPHMTGETPKIGRDDLHIWHEAKLITSLKEGDTVKYWPDGGRILRDLGAERGPGSIWAVPTAQIICALDAGDMQAREQRLIDRYGQSMDERGELAAEAVPTGRGPKLVGDAEMEDSGKVVMDANYPPEGQ